MRKWMRWISRRHLQVFILSLGGAALLAIVFMVCVNLWVLSVTRDRIHRVVAECPDERVGIVFGTSRWTRGGGRNPHFEGRMQAAAELAKSGRVEHLLLSGDNSTRYYNEPIVMWRDLRGRDVPDAMLTLDYAGFSTFDTLARAKQVFGLEDALLVTQSWHLPRALFIADAMGIKVQGCAAPEDSLQRSVFELRAREWLARVATVGDLYIWQRKPRFLGPLELISLPLGSERDSAYGAVPAHQSTDTQSAAPQAADIPADAAVTGAQSEAKQEKQKGTSSVAGD